MLPDRAYRGLLGGSAAVRSGDFAGRNESTGRVHVEREQGSLPFFAWPEAGDRVALIGSWVWDCGHWAGGGERTEIHPFRALWVERDLGEADLFLSSDKTFAGVEADCAHVAKGLVTAFRACLAAEPSWRASAARTASGCGCPGARRARGCSSAWWTPAAAPGLLGRGRGCAATASTSRSTCTRWRDSGS